MAENTPYDLFSQPDVAREIGFLIMYTATLEAWLVHPVASMLRVSVASAFGVLMAIDNVRAKIDIMLNLAEEKKGRPLPDDILSQKDALNAALAFRNTVAHSSFGFSLTSGAVQLQSNVANGGRRGKPKSTPLSCDEIRKHSEAVKSFIFIIKKQCGHSLVGNAMLWTRRLRQCESLWPSQWAWAAH